MIKFCESIWRFSESIQSVHDRFFESIHDCIVDCVVEAWDWIVEKLQPYALFVLLFNLAAAFLLLVTLLRGFFQ